MSEQQHESQTTPPEAYPGKFARYQALRNEREQLPGGSMDPQYAALCIAEELAGLSFLLDGIRYSLRK